jgi:hypothetical protein
VLVDGSEIVAGAADRLTADCIKSLLAGVRGGGRLFQAAIGDIVRAARLPEHRQRVDE